MVSVSSNFQDRSQGQDSQATGHHPLPSESGGTVVVADDTPAVAEYLARLLARDGHRVIRADNGADALELIAREQPDVALLDVMMPGRSGLDVCRAIKSDPGTRLIPVVLVTALQNAEDRIRGIEAGADGFLSKPPNPQEMLATARSSIRLKRYTDELGGEDIPLLAQIMSVVDVFDALTTDRPYRAAMTLDDACRELENEVSRGWRRANLVEVFITVLRETHGELFRPGAPKDLR